MAEESNEGIAYLKELKQPDNPVEATAATPARESISEERPDSSGAEADSGRPFKVTEKRRSYRYKCEGSAELREEGCEEPTWATFRDVSLHGCYMEEQATYPVGCILHMKLEANGVQVECKGTVHVNYPYLGMGIAFQEMSEASVARLREMLSKISRRAVFRVQGTTSSLAGGTLNVVAQIADPSSALRAVAQFFENRQTLMRDDFLSILRKSQSPHSAVKA